MIIACGTPIGNLQDASPRLVAALRAADVIAAEDTRETRKLMISLGIEPHAKFISMHDYNEAGRVTDLLEIAKTQDVVVVSDAGMPTVSDPGYDLIHAAGAAGVDVTVIPGPSAVLTALAISGLPTNRFSFEGFVPRKAGERTARWRALANDQRTTIHFESPHRIAETLASMAEVFGPDRAAAVCRELTKKFEEVKRGTLAELAEWAAAGVRGEIVIVVGPAAAEQVAPSDVLPEVLELVAGGERLKTACKTVADATGVSARELYQLALQSK